MTPSQIFVFACLSFIIGIFAGFILPEPQLVWLGFLFLLSLFLGLQFKSWRRLIFFSFMFFVLGLARADFSQKNIATSQLQNFFNQAEVILQGRIVQEPVVTEKNQKLIFKVEKVNGQDFQERGKILMYAPLYPKYSFGDDIKIVGQLESPPVLEDFDYQQHLARQRIYGLVFYPEIEVLSALPGRGKQAIGYLVYKNILDLKMKLRESIYQNFSFPQNLLLGSIILGDKTILPPEIKDILNKAGLRHLTAISGMHLTILINILMLLFLGLGFWRKQAFWLTAIFILFFVLMTGAQPSTIRASIMGFLFLLGQQLGRTNDSSRAILFGAVLMLALNPFFLLEAGFQLSFLAVMGINYLTPIFSKLFRKIPNTFQLRNILSMSLSAQIFTLPILIYNFGSISLVAPIANILVLPLLPFIIAFGFLSAIFGIFSYYLAFAFVFPCWLMLKYLLGVADFFGSLIFSALSFKVSWLWLVVFYLALAYFIRQWRREHRFKILGF